MSPSTSFSRWLARCRPVALAATAMFGLNDSPWPVPLPRVPPRDMSVEVNPNAHPTWMALTRTSLGKAQINNDPKSPLRLVVDTGIHGVADCTDIYMTQTGGRRFLTIESPVVQNFLRERSAGLSGDGIRLWSQQCGYMAQTGKPLPVFEGIHPTATPPLKLPLVSDEGFAERTDLTAKDRSFMQINRLTLEINDILRRHDIPTLAGGKTQSGLSSMEWLQDIFIPFDDGTIGIPPSFDPEKMQDFRRKLYSNRGSVINGVVLQWSSSLMLSMQSFADQGLQMRPMRALIEGGNIIFAKNNSNILHALIGSDTIIGTSTYYGISDEEAIEMIAQDLHMDPENVIVMEQPDFHIDMHMRAGKPGEVFVADLKAGQEMLDHLGNQSAINELKERVRVCIDDPVGKKQSERLEFNRSKLSKKGFKVIPYPSIYYSSKYFSNKDPQNGVERQIYYSVTIPPKQSCAIAINYMNNRYTTNQSGTVVSIALGSGYPAIDEETRSFEMRHGAHKVYFVGSNISDNQHFGNLFIDARLGGVGCISNF